MANEDSRLMGLRPATAVDEVSDLGVGSERLARYKNLLERAGLRYGFTRVEPGGIILLTEEAHGAFGHGSSEGYAYTTGSSPSPLVDKLAVLRSLPRGALVYSKLADGGWYQYAKQW